MLYRKLFLFVLPIILVGLVASGCSVTLQTGRRSDIEKIDSLNAETEELNAKLKVLQKEKDKEISELSKAKRLLESRLKKEIGEKSVRLEMAERGLAIIFLAEILFDSGKAEIKKDGIPALNKLADVLKKNLSDREIGVEGHTDNKPIKYSGWKSNWELSTARATSVLHYMVDQKNIDPKKIAATGYAEYRPVASNSNVQGRRQNRRVEVVVLPKNIEKIQTDIDKIEKRKKEIERRLKKYKK